MPWQQRLRSEFRLAVLSLLGAVSVLGILPFSLYRYAHGQYAAAAVDVGIVASIGAVVGYAWRGGRIERAAVAGVVAYSLGCVAVSWLSGLAGVFWTYPVVLGSFLLVDRGAAALCSFATTLAVALVAVEGGALAPGLPLAMFLATALLVGVFALLFAQRTRDQHRRLEELATRDPLTGAHNRRAMDRELQLAVDARARHGTDFAVALFDLDHFKRINDSHGHEAGDQVLVAFARLLRRGTRRLDQVYRIGGEEFVLLLSAADPAALRMICDGLRLRVAAELRCGGEPVTVSVGCAALLPGEDCASWLARADAALYRAKHGGRNRVEIAEPGDSRPTSVVGVEPGSSSLR